MPGGPLPGVPLLDEVPVEELGAGSADRWARSSAPGGPVIPTTPTPPPFPPPVPVAGASGPTDWPAPVGDDPAADWPAPVGDDPAADWPAPVGDDPAADVHAGSVSQLRSALEDLEGLLQADADVALAGEEPAMGADGTFGPHEAGEDLVPSGPAEDTGGLAEDTGGLADLFDDGEGPDPGGPVDEEPRQEPVGARAASGIDTYAPPVTRRIDYERLGDLVDRVTGYIGNRPQLAQRVGGFQLTRDRRLDAAQRSELEHIVTRELKDVVLPVTAAELPEVLDVVYDELIGLGPLGVVWRDPAVTEILVDGWDNIYVEVGGRLQLTSYRFRSAGHAESVARGLAERVSGRSLSPTNSLVTAELPAARVNFAYKPVVRSGLAITLRKLDGVMGMDQLLEFGSLTDEMARFLAECVASRAAVLVSGGTGVGKTTLLNALSESIGAGERVVTIEDSYELRLANRFVVSMQTKEAASGDDTIFVTQDQLLRNSLRMRPDRIVVGEMRDGEAAAVMLAAANTGHEGTMTTIHANSADSALNVRLTNMARAGADMPTDVARWEIAEAFDLVVQGTRSHYDGHRFVSEIAEVTTAGLDGGGRIQLRTIFSATMHPDAPVAFHRAGGIDPGGRLAQRLQSAGFDPGRWAG